MPYHVGSIGSILHIVDTLTLSALKKDLNILLFVTQKFNSSFRIKFTVLFINIDWSFEYSSHFDRHMQD